MARSSFARPPAGINPTTTTATQAPLPPTRPRTPSGSTTPVAAQAPVPTPTQEVLPPETVPSIPTPTKRTPRPSTAVVVNEPAPRTLSTEITVAGIPRLGETRGTIDPSDLQLPQLKIVSGDTSTLARLDSPIPHGNLVIGSGDQWLPLWRPAEAGYAADEAIGVTVLWSDKEFQQTKNEKGESLYDLQEQGLVFKANEDGIRRMQEAGGTLADVIGMKVFQPRLVTQSLVRLPVDVEDTFGLFSVQVEGVDAFYAPVMWYIQGSAYGECGKKILGSTPNRPVNCSHYGEFQMIGKRIVGKKNAWWIPKLLNDVANPKALVTYLEENA